MSNWTRLAVVCEADSILDAEVIYDKLSQHYQLGYTGVYDCGGYVSLYLQTTSFTVRMAPGKVFKICKEFGAMELPRTFNHRGGALVSEKGVFRQRGTQKGSKRKAAKAVNTTNTNNNITVNNTVNNTVNIDNRVSNTFYVQICPLGQEDVSHITVQQFNKIFGDSKEEVVRRMKGELTEDKYQQVVEEAWEGLRNKLYNRFFEERDASSKNIPRSDSESEEDSDGAPMMTPSKYVKAVEVNGEPIKYDPDNCSEYNKQAKSTVARISIMEQDLVQKTVSLPYEFAELLYSSPHNLNVRHPSKAGYIEYFDGKTWVKKEAHRVHAVIDNWKKKVKELYLFLKEKHGAEWVGSFSEKMASRVFQYSEHEHPAVATNRLDAYIKRRALLEIDNAEERVREVKRKTGKRLCRVLSESDYDARRGTLLRKTTWEQLMA